MPLRQCSLATHVHTLLRPSLLMDFAWNIISYIPKSYVGDLYRIQEAMRSETVQTRSRVR